MESVSKFIEKKLGLKVNMTKSKVSKSNDIKYLGFCFFKDMQDGLWKAKPHKVSVNKLRRIKTIDFKKLESKYDLPLDENQTADNRMDKLLSNRTF